MHRAFILYPLSLRVAASRGEQVQHLALSSVALSLPLSLLLGVIAGVAALVMSQPFQVAAILVAVVVATQSHEVLRWVFLARLQHRRALIADAIRHGTVVIGVLILSRQGSAGILGAFACLMGGATLGVAWQAWNLRLWLGSADRISLLAADAWRLGKVGSGGWRRLQFFPPRSCRWRWLPGMVPAILRVCKLSPVFWAPPTR